MVLHNLALKKVYQMVALLREYLANAVLDLDYCIYTAFNLILFDYFLLFCTGCQNLLTPQKDAMPKEHTHMLIATILIPICKHLESLGI